MTARSLRMASAPSTPHRESAMARRSPIRCRHGPLLPRSRSASRTRVPGRSAGTPCYWSGSARLHAGSPVIGQPARTGFHGDRLGGMPGPAGQHRQRLDGRPVLSGRVIPGMEVPRGGPQVLLLSTGPRPALIDVIDDREDRVLSSLLLSYPRGFSDEKRERGSWPIARRCGLRMGIAPGQWSMRRTRRSGRLRSGWRPPAPLVTEHGPRLS